MTLLLENETAFAPDFDPEETARAVILQVLDQEGCPYEAEVSLTLTDEDTIRTLNRQYRNVDRVTDVLSFPLVSFSSPCRYEELEEEEGMSCFHPESGELMLGDIVICTERARRQAKEYGHSLKREYAFLIAHSVLHLLGYDHMTREEAADMEERQERALRALSITRDADELPPAARPAD